MDNSIRAAQRAGIVLAVVEAILFGVMAVIHFGTVVLSPVAIVDACLAVVLVVAVFLPGTVAVRAGRVLGAQVLCLGGMFGTQIALLYGASLAHGREEICVGVVLLVALASMFLIATPVYGTRRAAR